MKERKRHRVLIVDDEESIRYTFETFLSDEGYEVKTARDYDEALELISKGEFDLILADIILGGKTGIDLLRDIKTKGITCPVVMITGYPNIDTASEAVRLGAFDYIPKPVRPETLLHTTSQAIKHKILQDENERFRSNLEAIYRSVKDAIITIDREMKIIEVNDSAQTICKMGREVIGEKISEIDVPCNRRCLEALEKTLKSKKDFELYRVECDHNGRLHQVVTVRSSPLINKKGEFSGAVMVVRDETRLDDLEKNLNERRRFLNLVGKSEKMKAIYSLIENLADVQTTVLITGESGTGKELVAEAIHYSGRRRNGPLVKVNCSALSENLLESELFGHVKGAFTGADRDKIGRFQKADGGTIFLDEIGDMSQRMQLRLLRVLQEKVFERVGDSTPIKVDVRVIAATNQDLSRKVKLGQFREDLYYRLKVVEINMPPLRERKDDIPLLVDHFIKKLNNQFKRDIQGVSDDVMRVFMNYPWPGNVRELEHALEHAFILCKSNTITIDHLPEDLKSTQSGEDLHRVDSDVEPEKILWALRKAGWNKTKAARLLGISVRTIYRKIEKYNLERYNDMS